MMRLAMVLQNQAPTTLNKYICNLAETILLDHVDGINLLDIVKGINEQFNLSFTLEEVGIALKRRANKRVYVYEGKYVLDDKVRIALTGKITPIERLNGFIAEFSSGCECDCDTEALSKLIKRYFYYSFNSNIDNLLFLLNKVDAQNQNIVFEATNEEVVLLNKFLMWDNPEKNEFIYKLISTCYEYCMLTVKKDRIVSSELFKGKQFFLDANIIFRMAGINNEERRFATQAFVDHCRDVSIKLSCTSSTLDEIYRVLASQIDYLRGIVGTTMPVSCEVLAKLNPNLETNDFYCLYYDWCNLEGNKVGDFLSFHNKLLSMIQDVLVLLHIENSTSYKVSKNVNEFVAQVNELRDYKNTRKRWRITSSVSAETDVTNILDVIQWRSGAGTSIWQTNDFIVSADQSLIAWAADVYPGVPIVVLPSVWLSMILRFTGRTDDDYKSFCLFLTQRQHIQPDETIDPTLILKGLKGKTNNKALKEQIIIEITQQKEQYMFGSPAEYEISLERAFDKIMKGVYGHTEQKILDIRAEMKEQMEALTHSAREDAAERVKIEAAGEREKTVNILAKSAAQGKVRRWKGVSNLRWIFYLLGAGIVTLGVITWLYEIQPLYSFIVERMPPKLTSMDAFNVTWMCLSVAVGLFVAAIGILVKQLASTEREQRLASKYREIFMKEVK